MSVAVVYPPVANQTWTAEGHVDDRFNFVPAKSAPTAGVGQIYVALCQGLRQVLAPLVRVATSRLYHSRRSHTTTRGDRRVLERLRNFASLGDFIQVLKLESYF